MDKYKFGKSQLMKQGWAEGKGLGKEETGMKDAIKVKLKHDTAGVGHDAGEEFSYHWWNHVYNKAASNIEVDNSEDTVNVKQNADFSISKKKSDIKGTFANKSMLYGRFIKSATLMGDSLVEEEKSSSDSDSEPDMLDQELCPDEVLFKKCGGRTAHKAARHGLGLSGKLLRIEQQEKLAESAHNTPTQSDENEGLNGDLKSKKKKKKKHKKQNTEEEDGGEPEVLKKSKKSKQKSKKADSEDNDKSLHNSGNEEENEDNLESKKKKKKKSKKSKTDLKGDDVSPDENKDSSKKSKKKKRKYIDTAENDSNEIVKQKKR